MKRGRRWFGWLIALLAVGYGAAILLRVPIARPFDYVLNLGATVAAPELAAPTDGKRRVVVLVHGSPWVRGPPQAGSERYSRADFDL